MGLSVAAGRRQIFGPEPWNEVAGTVWSHWDLWFCLVCQIDFGGDWRGLEQSIVGGRRRSNGGRDWEAMDSHLHDLGARLFAAGADPATLAAGCGEDRAVLAKARRKVHDQGLAGRDLTRHEGHPSGAAADACSARPLGRLPRLPRAGPRPVRQRDREGPVPTQGQLPDRHGPRIGLRKAIVEASHRSLTPGRVLSAEGISVVAIGGARNIGRFLDRFGPRGLGVALAELSDAAGEPDVRRGLERGTPTLPEAG